MATKVNDVMPAKFRSSVASMKITIFGTTDLVLNKMNARTNRELTDQRKEKTVIKAVPNAWEDIITSIHWKTPLDTFVKDTYNECNEELYHRLIAENQPCITAFGLKQSWCDAVVRTELDQYSTKFRASVNIDEPDGNIPVQFSSTHVEERLMSPKRGSPVLSRLNHFTDWQATFTVSFIDSVYSTEQVLNVIDAAGFGLGIGSGRSSGFGRYQIAEIGMIDA